VRQYVAFNVSKQTSEVVIVDEAGTCLMRRKVRTDPLALAAFVEKHGENVAMVGLEAGPLSTWLYHELKAAGLPVVCMDACSRRRARARAALSAQYLMLMTTLDAQTMPATQVLSQYRLRWQVEIAFKRLKSLAGLDDVQAKEARLAKAAIWAKLILAILTETLLGHVLALSPSRQTVALAPVPGPASAP
jgi:transposase